MPSKVPEGVKTQWAILTLQLALAWQCGALPINGVPPARMRASPPGGSVHAFGAANMMAQEPRTNMTVDQIIMMAYGGMDNVHPERLEQGGKMVLAELDMVLSKEQFRMLYDRHFGPRSRRKASADLARRWTNNVMPYEIVPGHFSAMDEKMLKSAIYEWQTRTCLTLRPATRRDTNIVRIKNGYGCNSQLGMYGGVQELNLERPGCRWRGLYLHELGHALGLVHEHQLPTRDEVIEILWNNVDPRYRDQFNKYRPEAVDTQGVPYDLMSIMHYGITAFGRSGAQTIRTRDRTRESEIGRVYLKELTFSDVKVVNQMYMCSSHCANLTMCSNGGFVDKTCRCVCPENTSGEKCEQIETCVDKHNTYYCQYWAEVGECQANRIWMTPNCARSCAVCTAATPKECKDVHSNSCEGWALRGECQRNPDWMIPNCRHACGRCTTTTTTVTMATSTTPKPPSTTTAAETTTPVTTATQAPCVNIYNGDRCRHYARTGACQNNQWVVLNCRKACDNCTIATCTNDYRDKSCEYWAGLGECERIPDWMIPKCRKSCNKCRPP